MQRTLQIESQGPLLQMQWTHIFDMQKARRAIFFGIHRDHSRNVSCEGLRDAGFRAEHVDGDDPRPDATG